MRTVGQIAPISLEKDSGSDSSDGEEEEAARDVAAKPKTVRRRDWLSDPFIRRDLQSFEGAELCVEANSAATLVCLDAYLEHHNVIVITPFPFGSVTPPFSRSETPIWMRTGTISHF